MRRGLSFLVLFLVASAPPAFAQAAGQQPPSPAYTLDGGKLAITAAIGGHKISWEGPDPNGVKVVWGDDADFGLIAGLRVGITRRLSEQTDVSLTRYDNDELYWRPEVPHNPYAVSGLLFTLSTGLRYDILKPGARVRPYAGGGLIVARFANVTRGATEFCVGAACQEMAPELFGGTKLSWYVDGGVTVFAKPRWGITAGVKLFPLPGSGSEPAILLDRPTGNDTFLHLQLYAGVNLHVT